MAGQDAIFAANKKFDMFSSASQTTKQGEKAVYNSKTCFECDLYFQPAGHIVSTEHLLSGAISELRNKTAVKEDVLFDKEPWVFIEITASPNLLPAKLWQLERAMRLIPVIDPSIVPASVVVLLNGDKEEAEMAMDRIIIPEDYLIQTRPVYIGWVPTRNIFNAINIVSKEVLGIQEDINAMKTNIAGMKTDIADMKTDIADMKITFSGIENEFSDMKTDIADMKTDIADMKIIFSGTENEFSGIKNEFSGMKSTLNTILEELRRK